MSDKKRALYDSPKMSAQPVRAVLAYALSQGVPTASIEQATGLSLIELLAPGERVPEETMPALLRCVAQERPGELVTLAMVSAIPLGVLGKLLQVMSLSKDVEQALQLFVRFAPLMSGQLRLWLQPCVRGVKVCIAHPQDTLDGGLGSELGVGVGARVLREVMGVGSALLQVDFAHLPNGPEQAYRDFFGVPVRFGAAPNGLLLRRAALGFPVNPKAGRRLELAVAQMDETLASLQGEDAPEALRAAREAVARCASDGRFGADDVAQTMGVGLRTLQRQLQPFDTSPHELIDEAREASAKRLLVSPELPMLEVALMLGYSTEAAFRRAFKRWTGESPGRWRRAQRA